MPLKKGKSKKVMDANYRELSKVGYTGKQRTAIMLSEAGMSAGIYQGRKKVKKKVKK